MKNYVATSIKNLCQLINMLTHYSIQHEMTSHFKIWCTFIPHMCLNAKFHDTIFIIKLCPGKGGRNQNITTNEVLLKGLEYSIDGNLFLIYHTCFPLPLDLPVYRPHYHSRGTANRLKLTHEP